MHVYKISNRSALSLGKKGWNYLTILGKMTHYEAEFALADRVSPSGIGTKLQ
jgi:hypothetical protein